MKIPEFVENIIKVFEKSQYEIFVVGGSVRDLLLGVESKDWDLTTNALPEQVLEMFEDAKYENDFGTVILPIKNGEGETEHVLEVTTYRSEQGYSDKRRPDEVKFEKDIDRDLARRDFTINALALKTADSSFKINEDLKKYTKEYDGFEVLDLFGGLKDLKKKIIRAVGEPSDRFREDALRMMRAVRFSCQLGFEIEAKTERAICKQAGSIKFVANERIQDELVKILSSNDPHYGLNYLHRTKMLQYIIPELYKGVGMAQAHHHKRSVFEHNMASLKHCPNKEWQVRLAALLHDVGKPTTMKKIKGAPTFYNHEYAGAKITRKIMSRLKFAHKDTERVTNLVRNHMFYYNTGEVTEASVRRLIKKTGKENLKDLIDLRIADRLGSDVKKAKPYRLRHLEYVMEKVQNDPVSVKMLKINGNDLMTLLKIKPGPKIGTILDVLLSEVIEDPKLNTSEYLQKRAKELDEISAEDLRKKAKEVIDEKRTEDDKKMKSEFKV